MRFTAVLLVSSFIYAQAQSNMAIFNSVPCTAGSDAACADLSAQFFGDVCCAQLTQTDNYKGSQKTYH